MTKAEFRSYQLLQRLTGDPDLAAQTRRLAKVSLPRWRAMLLQCTLVDTTNSESESESHEYPKQCET